MARKKEKRGMVLAFAGSGTRPKYCQEAVSRVRDCGSSDRWLQGS